MCYLDIDVYELLLYKIIQEHNEIFHTKKHFSIVHCPQFFNVRL